jgi:uncharacterized membrane protein
MQISHHLIRWVIWNTFLAVIPVAVGYGIYALYKYPHRRTTAIRAGIVILGLVWFAFMPNTCYLLTEWRHFLERIGYSNLHAEMYVSKDAAFELMVYTLFYMFYSGIGLLTFALAIRPIAWVMRHLRLTLWVWAMPFFLLMSLGVYLGLILRLNSWDLLTRPGFVWESVMGVLFSPTILAFIVPFAAFLWFVYLVMDIWFDGLACRLRAKE